MARQGPPVQFFHEAVPTDLWADYLCTDIWAELVPPDYLRTFHLLQSHGWLDATLPPGSDFEGAVEHSNPNDPKTWPWIRPKQDLLFTDRDGKTKPTPMAPFQVHPWKLRAAAKRPKLSILLGRWGGTYRVGQSWRPGQDDTDGGWGHYASPPSDWYMQMMIEEGVMRHPMLAGDAPRPVGSEDWNLDFEIFSLFIGSSNGAVLAGKQATKIRALMTGDVAASFWMLWPAEWADYVAEDYAGYLQRHAYFGMMRHCEAAGVRTAFPHPADLYELITSKTWMATLSNRPEAALPAATIVHKDEVRENAGAAAGRCLEALMAVRAQNPFPADSDPTPQPSAVNKDVVHRGVAKLGWSWEARFVSFFTGGKALAEKLRELLLEDGCLAVEAIVQEWVDFDFELRLFFLPPAGWAPPTRLVPAQREFNGWGKVDASSSRPGSFTKIPPEKVLELWQGDARAIEVAVERAAEVSQFLIAWLLEQYPEPVPFIRMDFMLRRLPSGQVRVMFGEYCEMGACCINWKEGPPTIWRAALDYAMR